MNGEPLIGFSFNLLARFLSEPAAVSIMVAPDVWDRLLSLPNASASSLLGNVGGVQIFSSNLLPAGSIIPLDGKGRPFEWFACDACGTKRPGSRGAMLACATCVNFWRAPS